MGVPLTLSQVPNLTPYIQYVATSSQTVFPYPFPITQDADLIVVVNGVTLATDNGYTLSGQGQPLGGNLTFTSGRTMGDIVTLFRNVAIQRITQIGQNSGYSSSTLNNEFNNLYLIAQQLQEANALCLQIPNTNNPQVSPIITPALYANKYLAFDSNGNPIPAVLTSVGTLTQAIIGGIYRPTLSWETGVVNNFYEYGDLRRFGCTDTTGGTAYDAQIANAITSATAVGGNGFIYHPGGKFAHNSTISVPAGITILGYDRNASVFTYSGTGDGWQYNNGLHNNSGYAKVNFRSVKLASTNAANTGAAIELNAGGYSYFQVTDCWLFGDWKYGIIADATEIVTINRNLIDLGGTPTACIWITNGADRTANQGTGFSNVITVRDNQISGSGGIGLIDDGGNNHVIEGNNLNAHSLPARFAGCSSLVLSGNSFETHAASSANNALFTNTTNAGNFVGACTNVAIEGVGFFGDMSAAGTQLAFQNGVTFTITGISLAASAVVTFNAGGTTNPFAAGSSPVTITGVGGSMGPQINGLSGIATAFGGSSGAWTVTLTGINSSAMNAWSSGGSLNTYHSGVVVQGNIFGAVAGRGNAIDVTYLANSFCGYNTDITVSSGAGHYTGVHNDVLGNTLLAPQNGAFGSGQPTQDIYGDSRFRKVFSAGLQYKWTTVPYSASMTFDLGTANHFDITATNNSNFTINSPSNANQGNRYSVTIRNTSGGGLGTVTWGPSIKVGAGIAYPATGNQRTYEFLVDSGGVSHQMTAAADVPN